MPRREQLQAAPTEVWTGQLMRNYFTIVDYPFTDKGLTLTMYRTSRVLRDHGLYPRIGFRDVHHESEGSLDEEISSDSLSEEFAYWSGNGFLWLLGNSPREGKLWLMPEDKRNVFKKTLSDTNKDFDPLTATLLRDTLTITAARVHAESLASHGMMARYTELYKELNEVGRQILKDS